MNKAVMTIGITVVIGLGAILVYQHLQAVKKDNMLDID